MRIPRRMGHIWIGPFEPPIDWMQTWKDKHPDWTYTLYDNEYLKNTEFETLPQIEEFMRRGWYAGASDLMRYEILFRHGGFLAEADSICIHPIDELFEDGYEIYTVYENEFLRGELVSPILASVPGHPFLRRLIDELKGIDPRDLDVAWKATGNKFVAERIERYKPEIKIWPSHVMIPDHYEGRRYTGTEKVYAQQLFGSARKKYMINNTIGQFHLIIREKLRRRYAQKIKKNLKKSRSNIFQPRA